MANYTVTDSREIAAIKKVLRALDGESYGKGRTQAQMEAWEILWNLLPPDEQDKLTVEFSNSM